MRDSRFHFIITAKKELQIFETHLSNTYGALIIFNNRLHSTEVCNVFILKIKNAQRKSNN